MHRFLSGVKALLSFSISLIIFSCATTRSVTRHSVHARKSGRYFVMKSGQSSSGRCRTLLPAIKSAAKKMGIEPALLVGLVRVESNFNPQAKSGVGARGLTQVMPKTGAAKGCGPLYDPEENLACGARVLRDFLRYYHNNLMLALSGYNAGHYYPDKANRTSTVPKNFVYVENVLRARAHFLRYGCRW